MQDDLTKRALDYHMMDGVPGKVSVVPSKPCQTAADLGLAYTPGVAKPVLAIEANPEDAYKYTSKGNLVAVISNGTAILGLGDRGALASKPVMEGKGVLFKRFADIDVFDIELDEKDPDKIIAMVKAMSPTFGGVNLEDIKMLQDRAGADQAVQHPHFPRRPAWNRHHLNRRPHEQL